MCVNRLHVLHENVRMVFVRSGFLSGGFCPSSDDYSGALNLLRPRWHKGFVLRDQRVYTV